MTLEEAIKQATEHAKAHNLKAYVHTDSALGHNFRFMRPIEEITPEDYKTRTVATVSPAGEVFKIVNYSDYLKALWPAGISEECTDQGGPEVEGDEDCITQNRHESLQCDSCRTYMRLAADWEARTK